MPPCTPAARGSRRDDLWPVSPNAWWKRHHVLVTGWECFRPHPLHPQVGKASPPNMATIDTQCPGSVVVLPDRCPSYVPAAGAQLRLEVPAVSLHVLLAAVTPSPSPTPSATDPAAATLQDAQESATNAASWVEQNWSTWLSI